MAHKYNSNFPLSDDELCHFHESVASALEYNLHSVDELISLFFGPVSAENAILNMLPVNRKKFMRSDYSKCSFEEFFDNNFSTDDIEPIEHTQIWREAAEYGGQGIAPRRYREGTMSEREEAVQILVAQADKALQYGSFVLEGVMHFG